jgi:hypothetical protein
MTKLVERARVQLNALSALVRRFAWTRPREYEWEHAYRALREQVRALLAPPQMGTPAFEAELRDGARP